MPEPSQSTPSPPPFTPPAAEEPRGPAASPPIVDPGSWEDGEGFRETFLLNVTDPKFNAALRVFGATLYDMTLDYGGQWPRHAEGETRAQLRAALGDLRHLQGFLTSLARGPQDVQLTSAEIHLCVVAGREVEKLTAIADRLEAELEPCPEN